jgi:uncharacterized membrane protein YoaK (UPF0700 family)
MFVSNAHSFQQQARLAITLAWVAGYTNVLTLLACNSVTSHMSGITSNLGREVVAGDWRLALFSAAVLFFFFIGAAVSGFATEWGRRHAWESIYVIPIAIQALLLLAFAILLEFGGRDAPAGVFAMIALAAAAMGLQNATITRISSGAVRTTHVTGVLTDLGHETVQFLYWFHDRRRNIPPAPPAAARGLMFSIYSHPTARRLALLLSIIGSFALGAGLGTLAYTRLPRFSMFPPVAFLVWIIFQDIIRPIAEIEPSSLLKKGDGLPESLAVYHLRKDHDRQGHVHRMPNLLAWSDRLPPPVRVVILDLGEVSVLDDNALMELRELVSRFRADGRQLILAGVTGAQFTHLVALASDLFSTHNLCSDLDLAIARGMMLAETRPTPP